MVNLLFITFSIALCLVNTAHAEVYRSVDESGNIIFTDKPHKDSEKVDLPGLTTYESSPYKEIKARKTKKPVTKFISYAEFKIISPASKDTIRDPDGNIIVHFLITPKLQIRLGHRIVLYVDGAKVASTTTSKYKLTNVDRGAHTLSAQIVDHNGRPFSKLISTVFYLVLVDDATKKEPKTGYDPDYKEKAEPKDEKRYDSEPEPENRYKGEPRRDDLHKGEAKDPNKYKAVKPEPKNLYKPKPPPTPNYKVPN